MGRLIDADALIELSRKTFSRADGFVWLINEQPTAYDIEKVVAGLNKEEIALEDNYGDYVLCVPTQVAIEIVRKGGAT